MNTKRLIAGILVGKPVGDKIVVSEKALEKSMQDVAQELEQEAMSNLKLADEVKAEWEQGCEHCVKGVYYEADGEDDVCPIECPYCVAT